MSTSKFEDKLERPLIYFTMIWGACMFIAGFIYFNEFWPKVLGLLLVVGVGIIFRKKL